MKRLYKYMLTFVTLTVLAVPAVALATDTANVLHVWPLHKRSFKSQANHLALFLCLVETIRRPAAFSL